MPTGTPGEPFTPRRSAVAVAPRRLRARRSRPLAMYWAAASTRERFERRRSAARTTSTARTMMRRPKPTRIQVAAAGQVTLWESRPKTNSNGFAGSCWPSLDRSEPRCTAPATEPTPSTTTVMKTQRRMVSPSIAERLPLLGAPISSPLPRSEFSSSACLYRAVTSPRWLA